MSFEIAGCMMLAVMAIVAGFVAVQKINRDGEVSKAAAAAGLVQQIVKVPNYEPSVIWVKPPAVPYVEVSK